MPKKLSEMLHKYINQGRKGKTDSSIATPVTLTDKQLCELWSKAVELESSLSNLRIGIKKILRENS